MKNQIVIGHNFGDEGKGTVVNWLCLEALKNYLRPVVCLASGGSQNAHTVNFKGTKHVFSSFGSGTLAGIPTIIDSYYMLDPICAMNEYKVLEEKDCKPRFAIRNKVRIITPYDVEANCKDTQNLSHGSCGKGIFKTFKRNLDGKTLDWGTCKYDTDYLLEYLKFIAEYHNLSVDNGYYQALRTAVEFLKDREDESLLDEEFDVQIHECSQGLMLDKDCGIDWPHLTPSNTGLLNFDKDILEDAEVFLVTRTYTTRHGAAGYTPVKVSGYNFEDSEETNVWNTYQGNFKRGALDVTVMDRIWERHNLDTYTWKYGTKFNLCISHIDTALKTGKLPVYSNSLNIYDVNTPKEVCNSIIDNLSYKDYLQHIYYSGASEGDYYKL